MTFRKIKQPNSLVEKVDSARELYNDMMKYREIKGACHWYEGNFLFLLKENNLYKFVFGESGSPEWKDFLSEVGISYTGAQQKMNMYEFYVEKHGFSMEEMEGVNTNNLILVLPKIKDKPREEVAEWILKCKTLSRNQLRTALGDDDVCKHEDIEKVEVCICKHCRKKVK